MAVLGRLLVSSGERIDLPDLLSIDSYGAGDWQYFMKTLVGEDTPYVIKGFDVITPANAIGSQSCSINIADSAMFYPGSSAGSFYYGLPAGNPNALPLVPELRKSATNYVYLTFTTFNTAEDTRAFWDPDANGGVGDEFTQEVNTESVIEVQVNVSTASFPDNTVPVAIITVGTSVITSIEDARPMMFRLGSGGNSPNPSNRFAWPALPNSNFERLETPNTLTSGAGQNPFQGGDKNIDSLKEWMDAVMSKLAELGGTQYWYEDTSSFSIVNIFHDALATTFKSKGKYEHSSATPGLLTYTEDVLVLSVSDPRRYIIRAGALQIPNEYVAYIPLVRAQPSNNLDEAVSWTNGQPYVNTPNGSIGFFANLSQGDWIKKQGDDETLFLRVEQFYDTTNLGGSVTTAANAKSIRLSASYQGSTSNEVASYDKGVYLSTDIQIQARTNPAISAAGGNFLWFAIRSDVTEGISSISSVTLTGTLDEANGNTARCNVTAHGLVNGDRVTITTPAAQAGTYSVDVADANTFFISTTNTTTGSLSAFYGLLTTAATNNGYGLQLESADHGFDSGEEIIIAGTTNWNGEYVVNYRSATQVQFAAPSALATETAGSATLARMDVRTERGITKVVQGETIDIGENDSANIQSYIGMSSLAETAPTYFIPAGYNTLSNGANYNGTTTDNLTQRAANLTAMMADKAQDKTIKYLTNAVLAVNTANGSAQELTFSTAGSILTLLQPGNSGNAVVALPSASPGISMLVNQSAYVSINRNAASTPTITVVNTALVPIDENVFVIASRLSDASVYIWNGEQVVGSVPLTPGGAALIKARLFDPISTTLPTGNPIVADGVTINAGDLVLYSNLGSGNNELYMATGTGTNITGWVAQFVFNGSLTPSSADTVIISDGTSFKDQIGKFNGTTWDFNSFVRYFNTSNGTVDYWEQSNIVPVALTDNTTNGTVFSINYTGSENMIVDFSVLRGTSRDTGTLHIATDGVNVEIAQSGTSINNTGVTFTGQIISGVFSLLYTSTSTGSAATMKLMIRRWSDLSGGPGGVPSYSGASSSVSAAGNTQDIQFNTAGLLDANDSFKIDTTNGAIVLNGLYQTILSAPITMVDNTVSPAALFSFNATAYAYAVVEYSVARDTDVRTGRLLIANNGTISTQTDDYTETGTTGVAFTTTIVGSNVVVMYTTTNTGFNGTFKYSTRRWS